MISVIIPVYNVEEYLHDCLNSVLNQTYQNFEIICVDDCSTDSSLEILKEFSKLDSRIKIIQNEVNSSLGFSRNKGLEYAKGKYVLFLDSDDWIDFNTLEILHDKIEKDNLEVLIFKAINYDDEKKVFYKDKYYSMKKMDKYLNQIFNHNDLSSEDIMEIAVSAWNKLYLKSFIINNDLKFPVKLIHEDNPFFYEMLSKAKKISIIDEYFYNRRRRIGSITTRNGKEVLDVVSIVDSCFRVALNRQELYQKHKITILNKVVSRLNIKYNFIEDSFKEEFLMNSTLFMYNICSEYSGVWNDFHEFLNKQNLDFLKFLNLNVNNYVKILFNEYQNKNSVNDLYEDFLGKILNFSTNEEILVDATNHLLRVSFKNALLSNEKDLICNKVLSQLYQYLDSLMLDKQIKFYNTFKKNFLGFDEYYSEFNLHLKKSNKLIFEEMIKYTHYFDFILNYRTKTAEYSDIVESKKDAYKISVIIPVYNTGNLLKRTLNSIINQTFNLNDIEVIMINDCSSDKLTVNIMEEYSHNYDNFKLIHLKNNEGSSGIPRNIGIKESKSDYIMFLDHDDYYEPTACELLFNIITEKKSDIVFGHYKRFINDKPANIKAGNKTGYFKNIHENELFFTTPPLNIWTKIYKKDFINKFKILFPPYLGEDVIFLVKAFLNAEGIIFLKDDIVYNYDVKQTSTVSNLTLNHFIQAITSEIWVFDYFNEKNVLNYFKYRISTLCDFILPNLISSDLQEDEIIYLHPILKELILKFDSLSITPNNNQELFYSILSDNLQKTMSLINK